ncbi:MAG: YbaB/EbfC family nucleoid-associated protein, partial [Deltaproteobacteria bacterium]|nr:YbaB/EbfC family nucleoid-associated protein [Deltaproteobacteria bacterium]
MKNFGKMIKQAQELQAKMSALQGELGQKQVEATAGGGMVTTVVNGNQELVSLTIEKEVVDPEDVELLQDLITAAVNEAISRSKEMVRDEMTKLT